MRLLTFLSFILFLHIAAVAEGVDDSVEGKARAKADSVYKNLSKSGRENLRVWTKGLHGTDFSDYHIGGLYLESYEQYDRGDASKFSTVALQTDAAFNPLQNEEPTPSLASLSSIRNNRLLNDYLMLLRESVKKAGIHFIVLPHRDSLWYYEGTIERIQQFDPSFFIFREDLSFNPEAKRREFYPILKEERAIVVTENRLTSYERTLRKGPRRTRFSKSEIISYLHQAYTFQPATVDRGSTMHNLWAQSITLYEKDSASLAPTLPVRSDTLAIWVSDENNRLFRELEQYYGTVLNLKYDRIPQGVPVIIDSRFNIFQASEYGYQLQETNPITWICTTETLINVNASAYLLTSQVNPQHDKIIADIIYGGEKVNGFNKVPLPSFMGSYAIRELDKRMLLSYGNPEWVGMESQYLDSIDLLAQEMIQKMAAPGCQVLVAKDGKIVFERSYGYLTYDSLIGVAPHTLYDLASLTKVSSTLLAVMSLSESGQIHLDSTVSYYLPAYKNTNKEKITIREILAHNAGLPSYIPFWKRTLNLEGLETFYYKDETARINDQRSYGIRPDPTLKDSLFSWIRTSGVSEEHRYKYSDIGFMLLQNIVENITSLSIEDYVSYRFYRPLSLRRTFFNPLQKGMERHYIAPTEYDYFFREEQIWGDVHDRNAAILGGVGGHAGLFSTAGELAILYQMFLQDGRYDGGNFLNPATISTYNRTYFENNRRGLGWDKPGNYNPNVSSLASKESFGHTGFTGTLTWVDPEHNLLFVFLSNRIFPDASNWKLNKLDTRRRMHDLVYKSIKSH